jgi:ABC-type multidrug transport system fused ATPase/permease subunit
MAANLALLVALWKGGQMVTWNEISAGQLTSFLMYSVYVGSGMAGLSSFYNDLMKSVGASHRIFQLMEKKSELVSGKKILPSIRGDICFQNVSFAYPTRKTNTVLCDLNLLIQAGTTVAIIGESGSGKSTIGSLIFRLYDPDEGHILLDNCDITSLDLNWLHDQMAIVSQEPVLFATSIAENIAYGVPDATIEQIQRAASKAHAAEFIVKFPNGYLTNVGERGLALSGGQKQRIAIARAILKDPKILILDEATSALDTASEDLVQKALDELMQGRTVIVIAHRLATIKNADVVVVLKKGRVVEIGTYNQLITKSDSLFREMIEKQEFGL